MLPAWSRVKSTVTPQTAGSGPPLLCLADPDFGVGIVDNQGGKQGKDHHLVHLGGPDHLREGVADHHGQTGGQHGQQGVPVPLPALYQRPDGSAQQKQEGGQAQHARLIHNLDQVVVDIFGFIVEALHRRQLAFHASGAPADEGALGSTALIRPGRRPGAG